MLGLQSATQSGPELMASWGIPGLLCLRTERSLVILLRSLVPNALGILSTLHQPAKVFPVRWMHQALEAAWAVCDSQVPGQVHKRGDMEQRTPSHFSWPTVGPSSSLGPTNRCLGGPFGRAVVSALPLHLAECCGDPLLLYLLEGKGVCMLKWAESRVSTKQADHRLDALPAPLHSG